MTLFCFLKYFFNTFINMFRSPILRKKIEPFSKFAEENFGKVI